MENTDMSTKLYNISRELSITIDNISDVLREYVTAGSYDESRLLKVQDHLEDAIDILSKVSARKQCIDDYNIGDEIEDDNNNKYIIVSVTRELEAPEITYVRIFNRAIMRVIMFTNGDSNVMFHRTGRNFREDVEKLFSDIEN